MHSRFNNSTGVVHSPPFNDHAFLTGDEMIGRLFALFSLCCFLFAQAAVSVAAEYKIIDLGTFGGSRSSAQAINDNGQIIVSSETSDRYRNTYLWHDEQVMVINSPEGAYNCLGKINNNGQVVGTYNLHPYWVGFIWQNGTMTHLNPFGGEASVACSLNNGGQIAGYATASTDYYFHACTWQNGIITMLGSLGGSSSGAYDINNNGQVVGTAETSNSASHAALWQNGNVTDLGTLPGHNYSEALSINDNGWVVGRSSLFGDTTRAFLWKNGTMTELDTSGSSGSIAYDINNSGQVVGASGDNAVLWQNGSMINLSTLGGRWSTASGINNSGWIVGTSSDADDNPHAVLWVPVPEPSSILTFLCGIAGMGNMIWRPKSV